MSKLTNLYKDEVDFAALALQDSDFAKVYVFWIILPRFSNMGSRGTLFVTFYIRV